MTEGINPQTSEDIELKNAIKKRRLWLLINGIFLFLCVGLAAAIFTFTSHSQTLKNSRIFNLNSNGSTTKAKLDNLVMAKRAIDGVIVEKGKENLFPLAVMIENHVDSRPAAALAKANLVYEALAEGAITRFLAIYASGDEIEKIGPVRSARPYYIDWAEEYNAVYSHCGGSPEALVKIAQDNIFDMNEFYNAPYFWREVSRQAPHNVYTSMEKVNNFILDKNFASSSFETWKYKEDADIAKRPDNASTTIFYRGPEFIVKWVYDKENNEYARYMGGAAHVDEDGNAVIAKNIIIQTLPATVLDDKLRLKMETIGFGPAIACLDGVCTEAVWKKNNGSARTRFYYKSDAVNKQSLSGSIALDKEVEFNAGTTWVEVIQPGIKVAY